MQITSEESFMRNHTSLKEPNTEKNDVMIFGYVFVSIFINVDLFDMQIFRLNFHESSLFFVIISRASDGENKK